MTTWLVQALCPRRHCVVGLAVEGGSREEALGHLAVVLELALGRRALNPWCGLCQAPRATWTLEAAALPGTLAEWQPRLAEEEAQQMRVGAALGEAGDLVNAAARALWKRQLLGEAGQEAHGAHGAQRSARVASSTQTGETPEEAAQV